MSNQYPIDSWTQKRVCHIYLEARNPEERLVRYRIGTESNNGTVEPDEHWKLRRQQARPQERRESGEAFGWIMLLLEASESSFQSERILVSHS